MTDAEMQALRAAAEKATPGPWLLDKSVLTAVNAGKKHIAMVNYYNSPDVEQAVFGREHEANATFIALANPAAVLALLDRVAAAEARAAKVRTALETIKRGYERTDISHQAFRVHAACIAEAALAAQEAER